MAYSDYVQIYGVYNSAGIASGDDLNTQVTKIAAWINGLLGDYVTADVYNNAVRVIDKDIKMGVCWGQLLSQSSNTQARFCIGFDGSDYVQCSTGNYTSLLNVYPLSSLGLFVCRGENGYVIDFINMSLDPTKIGSCPRFIKAAYDGGYFIMAGDCMVTSGTSADANKLRISTADSTATLIQKASDITNFLEQRNINLSQTLLTSFSPRYCNCILDNLYKVNGAIPPSKSVFEINGVKYLSLDLTSFNNTVGLAFKLG